MPRGNSQQNRGGGRGGYGRGGYNPRFGSRGGVYGSKRPNVATAISTGPANQRAVNPLNQYYSDKFVKIKKDADSKGMKNQSFCYKRVISALSKYPMPILCVEQAQFLEGVGDTVAQRFAQMIAEREKEFEDGLFFGALASEQQQNDDAMPKQFAGINLNDVDIEWEELQNMSLKQFLMEQDRLNFELKSGIVPQSKKRKLDQMQADEEGRRLKKRMMNEGFLDLGTVSWSLALSVYFLSLHKGAAPAFNIENSEKYCMNYESCMEMLQVLAHEFGDMIPLETNQDIMISQSAGALTQMRENSLIQCLPQANQANPLLWQFTLTQKGSQRGKNLAKSVGLVAKLEVDLENKTEENGGPREKSANKVTINMYDKELMPVVDELYLNDQSMSLLHMKQEGKQEEVNSIFDQFISSVENSIFEVITGDMSYLPQMKEGNIEMLDGEQDQQNSTSFQNIGLEQSRLLLGGNLDQFEEAIDQNEGEDGDFGATQTVLQNYQNTYIDQSVVGGDVDMKSIAVMKDEEGYAPQAKFESKYEMDLQSAAFSEVILFVDNREKRNNQDGNYLYERLTKNGLRCELKSLPLGDFLWVLRFNSPAPEEPEGGKKKGAKKKANPFVYTDYVLDFITERKTADDLAASIMDGRYEEQKYRLKNCGINNVVYLVEGSPGQYCKIPEQVLKKAQIHTQIFHNFNVLRLATIQESLRWLTQMTNEIIQKTDNMKKQVDDFETRIAASLVEFKQFQNESGKNSNLTTQQIFARQLRTVRGLGVENIAAIVRVFKTPYLLRKSYMQCLEERHIANLLNAGKLELMKNKTLFRDQIVMQREEQDNVTGDGHPDLPKSVEDIDKIALGNVVVSAQAKLFPKLVTQFEKSGGVKMRKINKNQCKAVHQLLCQESYIQVM